MLRSSARGAGAAHDIVSLARERLADAYSVHFAPSIPPRKEAGARRAHALHLPENEPILVLFDNTLLGSAEVGFVMTPARLCWKNILEHPRQIAWEELDPASVALTEGGLRVAGGKLMIGAEIAAGASAVIYELAARFGRADADPYRAHPESTPELGAGGSIAVARLVALARRHVGEVDAMYYHPGIPSAKLRNARATHAAHLPEDEAIAVLFDDTLFGSAVDGFVITPERLCSKIFTGEAKVVRWPAIAPDAITTHANFVHVGELSIQLTAQLELVAPVAALLAAIAAEARGEEPR